MSSHSFRGKDLRLVADRRCSLLQVLVDALLQLGQDKELLVLPRGLQQQPGTDRRSLQHRLRLCHLVLRWVSLGFLIPTSSLMFVLPHFTF